MPVAWYISPYRMRPPGTGAFPTRYPAVDDYVGPGNWAAIEVMGNRCLAKVRATPAQITAMNADLKRIPKDALNDSLADLSTGQKQAIKAELLDMGYTIEQIKSKIDVDNLQNYTLRDVLEMARTHRLRSRYDATTETVVADGDVIDCMPLNYADNKIS